MKLKNRYFAMLMATGISGLAHADDLMVESFETDGQGVRYTASQPFNDGTNDHWNRTDGTDISNVSGAYSGQDGTFFWAAEDVNDNGGNGQNPQTMDFTGIDINGFINLGFSGLFGAGNESLPGESVYDAADFVQVAYQIDGGGYINALCFGFEQNGDNFNEPFGLDADCDGESDGPADRLGTTLEEFGFVIAETGSVLDLRISVAVDAGNEEFAFDNLKITGDISGVDNPPAVTTTVPTDTAVDVAIDSNVLINFNEAVNIASNAIEISCAVSGVQAFPVAPVLNVTSIEIDAADFVNSEVCSVTVDAASVTDLDGLPDPMAADFMFSFTVIDDLDPTVINTTPADGSVGVAVDADLSIEFSEAIDATVDAVTLNCSQSGAVTFTGLPVDDSTTITLNPDADLIDTETCDMVVVATEVADIDGMPNNMAESVLVSFRVGFQVVEIFDIQGSGMVTPFLDTTVTSNNNIVTALDTNGFYLQTPDDRDDNVLATSNGIFIFTGGAPSVAVGDMVNVTAEVTEFFDSTQFTGPGSQIITVVSSGNALPTAIILDDNFPSTDPTVFDCGAEFLARECYEGMYFEMPQGFVSAASVGFFGGDRDDVFVKAGASRAFREPGIDFPGLPDLPVFDGNPELIEMSIEALGLPFEALSAGTEFSAKGVIAFGFGDYELQPSEVTIINENVIPGAVRDAVGEEITVASANLFRLFNDIDDPGSADDDQIADSAEYANRLVKLAKYFVEDMKSPTIIALQEIENISVLQDLSVAIANAGGPSYISTLVEGNDVGGINVAYMYQAGSISNVMVTQLGKDEINPFDNSLLHDRPPLRLEADVILTEGTQPLNLLVVHMRSRSSIDDNSDGDRVRNKRLNQANSIAVMAQSIIAEDPDKPLYVLGDFNAFEFTDGYVDVVGQITGTAVEADNLLWSQPVLADGPLTQAVQTLAADEQYSFIFQGSAQVLDNALMNDVALMNLVDMQYVRGQADANVNFEDGDSSLRSTDHDGFVLYILDDNDLIFKNGFE